MYAGSNGAKLLESRLGYERKPNCETLYKSLEYRSTFANILYGSSRDQRDYLSHSYNAYIDPLVHFTTAKCGVVCKRKNATIARQNETISESVIKMREMNRLTGQMISLPGPPESNTA